MRGAFQLGMAELLHKSRVLVVAAGLGAVAVLGGCGETPAQGFEGFYTALAAGEQGGDDALAHLSTHARADLAAAARAKGLEPARYLTGAIPKTTVRSIAVVEESADTATLEVKDALGKAERVTMKKEDGHWRVDLSP